MLNADMIVENENQKSIMIINVTKMIIEWEKMKNAQEFCYILVVPLVRLIR